MVWRWVRYGCHGKPPDYEDNASLDGGGDCVKVGDRSTERAVPVPRLRFSIDRAGGMLVPWS